jgi:mannose-6-phosphate isomerase-like protein (cupin superfamily)
MIRKALDMEAEVRPNMRGGNGSVTVRHFFKKEEISAKTRLCAKLTLPPGASIGVHQHAGEDELFVIAKGSGVLDDGSRQTVVTAGDAVLTGKGESHAIANNGEVDLEIIAVIMCYA